MNQHRVQQLRPEDWRRWRDIRLRALSDAPDAFGSTLADSLDRPDQYWTDCLARDDAATFVSTFSGTSDDVGVVVVAPYDNEAGLFAMWVSPSSRKSGIGMQLVEEAVRWAWQRGYTRILLDVADDNHAAIALYVAHGFEATGETGCLPPPREHILEHQRALELNNSCEPQRSL